jgi:hypothetical protein
MSHFNLKSLVFYGTMIGSVLILFKVVSNYGENSLKAPVNISGTYRFNEISINDCLKNKTLELIIQQSGRYLGGTLNLTNTSQTGISSVSPNPANHSDSAVETEKSKPEEIRLSGLLASLIILNNDKTALGSCPGENDQLRLEIQPKEEKTTVNLYWSSIKSSFIAEKVKNQINGSN